MAIKRIKKDQVDAGKKELPKKLAFLTEGKIDYANVGHDESTDDWTVELPLAAIRGLARKAAELKELKRAQKEVTQQAALVPALQKDRAELIALRETTADTDALLRKATRRVTALEKQLSVPSQPPVKAAKASTAKKAPATKAEAAPAEQPTAPTTISVA